MLGSYASIYTVLPISWEQQYVKSLSISSKEQVSKNLVLEKLSSQELVLKSPQEEAFKLIIISWMKVNNEARNLLKNTENFEIHSWLWTESQTE